MRILIMTLVIFFLPIHADAAQLIELEAPKSTSCHVVEGSDFSEGLQQLLENTLPLLDSDLLDATQVGFSVIAAVLMISLLQSVSGSVGTTADYAGCLALCTLLLFNTGSLISLAVQTVTEMSDYGKLLLPVMTAGLAAQGGITGSAALYGGTAVFNTLLTALISNILVPMVYMFLALSAANSAVGDNVLKRFRDLIKGFASWCLKTLLIVFTTYMSITGVISGTTDAAALKATKVTISTMVPVVGGILSDASEAVLVSAGIAKNAAGLYGILAILAVFLHPFLQIGMHYLVMKATAAICGIFGTKRMTELIGDFSAAMGLLLAMTGASCLLLLISTVCFLKGVG